MTQKAATIRGMEDAKREGETAGANERMKDVVGFFTKVGSLDTVVVPLGGVTI